MEVIDISNHRTLNVAKVGVPCVHRAVNLLAALPLNRFNVYFRPVSVIAIGLHNPIEEQCARISP